MITLTLSAAEKGTYFVTCTFTDEEDAAVTPTSFKWSLTDLDGRFVNGREDEVETPAEEIVLVLSGLDLALGGTPEGRKRLITVEATYTSTHGAGLPLHGQAKFEIEDFEKIS